MGIHSASETFKKTAINFAKGLAVFAAIGIGVVSLGIHTQIAAVLGGMGGADGMAGLNLPDTGAVAAATA
jgi:hypothetical protein